MNKIDLTQLSELELMSLRNDVNNELDQVKNRSKKKCYYIFQPFEGKFYFKTFESMWTDLFIRYNDWDLFDKNVTKIEFGIDYLSDVDFENLTED